MDETSCGHATALERSCSLTAVAISAPGSRSRGHHCRLGVAAGVASRLVSCATAIRTADEAFHFEPPSTRVLVTAAQLIAAGAGELEAAESCLLAPLSIDGAISDGLREITLASLAPSRTSGTH